MTDYTIDGIEPSYEDRDSVYVAPGAMVIGKVLIGRDVNIWPHAVIRGDNEQITIGAGSNVQEHTMMHTDPGFPLTVGENCTVGHRAILHGCAVGDNSLIGMGAIVLNGAKIGCNSLVGAGALVTEGKEFADRSLIVGSPARAIRTLDDNAIARLKASAVHYVANGKRFKIGLKES
jgi:carbonic anhydrase/acetyltransferase-like protein (isoleucine patch superfamily)